ncbi:MAG: hypothetical protein LBP51_02125, partial [Deferribacteraceae bacterium]|nr:hypothetical protein [Deferribacteraceae bacterium]
MPIVKYHERVDLPHIDYYPLFVDYDLSANRPRGGSTCIDFFSVGKLAKLVDACGKSELIYVHYDKSHPSEGWWVTDFSRIK